MIHYIPKPTFEAYRKNPRIILVAACGERKFTSFTCAPHLNECPACKRAMISEEAPR